MPRGDSVIEGEAAKLTPDPLASLFGLVTTVLSKARGVPVQQQKEAPTEEACKQQDYMRRADFGRLVLMDSHLRQVRPQCSLQFDCLRNTHKNHASWRQANQVRQERSQNKQMLHEQRERFRQRGLALRAQRMQTEAAVAYAVDSCRNNAQATGNSLRHRQRALRLKRSEQEKAWERHGRGLTEKYSTRGNQALVRALKKEVADEKARAGTELRNFLKQAKKDTDDTIAEVNHERVERVYAETAHTVIRAAKQGQLASRWDRADDVRSQVSCWKKEIQENEAQYLERAWAINDDTSGTEDVKQLAQKRHEDRVAYARQQTQWRKGLTQQRKVVADDVRSQNRSVHDLIDLGQLVPQHVIAGSILGSLPSEGGESSIAMFTRIFGFKRLQRPHSTVVAI